MLTQLEQDLLVALKLARDAISGMSQHWGEGPPEADADTVKIIQIAYERAESTRLQIPTVLSSEKALVIASWNGHELEAFKKDDHVRGRIVKVGKKRREMLREGAMFHGLIEDWEALKERGRWLHR